MVSKSQIKPIQKELPSTQYRDLSSGRISTSAANVSLVPINSVSQCGNVNFDKVVGAGVVRNGTTALTGVVSAGNTPLGLAEFVGIGGTPNLILAVYNVGGVANLFYYNGTWNSSSSFNALGWGAYKVRFAILGGYIFAVNSANNMVSSTDGITWGTTNCSGISSSVIYRFAQRLLTAGNSTYPDRVYFSGVVSPQASPSLTWNTDPSTGNWIDVNPDDGDNITGFSDCSGKFLVFKSKGFYGLDVVNITADTYPIYDEGAVSQEAICKCQGMVYFYSGTAIYSTNGGYPTQISRLGVQDFLDAIPQANWSNVSIGADTFNIYVSTGAITMSGETNYYVLKFSIRDQAWSVHYYPVQQYFYAKYTTTNGRLAVFADNAGYVQLLNLGNTDNGTPIFYHLETQELDFGNRASTTILSNKMVVYGRNMMGSKIEYKNEKGNWVTIPYQMTDTVNVFDGFNVEGKYFKFKWSGQTSGARPVFEGLYFPDLIDQGVID